MKKNLILIDDHTMILHGLETFIEHHSTWQVLFKASSENETLENLENSARQISENNSSTIALIDIKLEDTNGYELCKLIKEKFPNIKCIMYSMYSSYGNVMTALECGADGFVSKTAKESELIAALDRVSDGEQYIQEDLRDMMRENTNFLSLISLREKQILDYICKGNNKTQICRELGISKRTCENYLSLLYDKLDVKDMNELQIQYGGKV